MNNDKGKNSVLFKSLQIILILLCSIIGVGFISGAEIFEYFAKFKCYSYVGIVCVFVILFVLSLKTALQQSEPKNRKIVAKNPKNDIKIINLDKISIKNFLNVISLCIVCGAMCSGLKILAKQFFGSFYFITFFICILICFFILLFGVSGISKFDFLVLIFLVVIIFDFIFSGKMLSNFHLENNSCESNLKFVLSSGFLGSLYVFMNISQLVPIVSSFGVRFSKKQAVAFSLIFSLAVTSILFVFVEFAKLNPEIENFSMPFLSYYSVRGGAIYYIFALGLFFALLSSLLSALFGIKKYYIDNFGSRTSSAKYMFGKDADSGSGKVGNDAGDVKSEFVKNAGGGSGKFGKRTSVTNSEFCKKAGDASGEFNKYAGGVKSERRLNFRSTLISILAATVIGLIDFDIFIKYLYPIVGILNFVILIFL